MSSYFKKFNEGDLVVCKNSNEDYSLTLYKTYRILQVDHVICLVINDVGDKMWYNEENFMSIHEYRNVIIDSIIL